MFINRRRGEINLKLVYYGPPLSGKTTNLERIHAMAPPDMRGQLVSLKTHEDRTLFFDFMQLELGTIGGLRPKFNLYTVPGQVMYSVTRKIVLQGADGVAFVADSSPDRMEANKESWEQLHQHLQELRVDPDTFPIVVQFNKRDLPDAVSIPDMKSMLGIDGTRPCLEAIAIQNKGVKETLHTLVTTVLRQVVARSGTAR